MEEGELEDGYEDGYTIVQNSSQSNWEQQPSINRHNTSAGIISDRPYIPRQRSLGRFDSRPSDREVRDYDNTAPPRYERDYDQRSFDRDPREYEGGGRFIDRNADVHANRVFDRDAHYPPGGYQQQGRAPYTSRAPYSQSPDYGPPRDQNPRYGMRQFEYPQRERGPEAPGHGWTSTTRFSDGRRNSFDRAPENPWHGDKIKEEYSHRSREEAAPARVIERSRSGDFERPPARLRGEEQVVSTPLPPVLAISTPIVNKPAPVVAHEVPQEVPPAVAEVPVEAPKPPTTKPLIRVVRSNDQFDEPASAASVSASRADPSPSVEVNRPKEGQSRGKVATPSSVSTPLAPVLVFMDGSSSALTGSNVSLDAIPDASFNQVDETIGVKEEPVVDVPAPQRRKTTSWGQGVLSRAASIDSALKATQQVETEVKAVLEAAPELPVAKEEPAVQPPVVDKTLEVVAPLPSKTKELSREAIKVADKSKPKKKEKRARTIAESSDDSDKDFDDFVKKKSSRPRVVPEDDPETEAAPAFHVKSAMPLVAQEDKRVESDVSYDSDSASDVPKRKQKASAAVLDNIDETEEHEHPRKKRGRPTNLAKAGAAEKLAASSKPPAEKLAVAKQVGGPGSDRFATVGRGRGRLPSGMQGPVVGAGRGRGRRPNSSGSGKDPMRVLTGREQRRMRDRVLLPAIFHGDGDLLKAFTSIRYMVNIVQGGNNPMYRFMKLDDVPLQKHAGKIPMPLSSEIAVCLDIIEAKSVFIWRQLTELAREEAVISKLPSLKRSKPAQTDSEIIADVTNMIVLAALGEIPYKAVATVVEDVVMNVAPTATPSVTDALLDSVYDQNKGRIGESYITLTAVETKPKEPLEMSFFAELVAKNRARILSNRAAATAEIRRRKLNTRRAWEALGDHYLSIQNKHQQALDDEEEAEEDEMRSRGGRPVGMSRYSSRLGGSSFARGDVIRSEYDSDRLLQALLLKETMEMRILKGKCDIPDMDSPWQQPDLTVPIIPLRDHDSSYGSLPSYISKVPDVVDSSGNRLTTDGKRQVCSLAGLNEQCPKGCNCARQCEIESRRERVWTDTEKCIFIDKFLQYPKNFPKISSFLANRDTKDCIKFYYDSKAKIQYKSLLREFDNRRRNQRNAWTFTAAAADSTGGGIYLTGESIERDAIIELPVDDISHRSYLQHPPFMGLLFGRTVNADGQPKCMMRKGLTEKRFKPLARRVLEVEAAAMATTAPFEADAPSNSDNRGKGYMRVSDAMMAAKFRGGGGRGRGRGRGRLGRPPSNRDATKSVEEEDEDDQKDEDEVDRDKDDDDEVDPDEDAKDVDTVDKADNVVTNDVDDELTAVDEEEMSDQEASAASRDDDISLSGEEPMEDGDEDATEDASEVEGTVEDAIVVAAAEVQDGADIDFTPVISAIDAEAEGDDSEEEDDSVMDTYE